ncbi:hypothetical protein BN946_scf184941.g7 [Trametes cinnabarina]|uniref:Uncharacterized protein n=1 Tax=Pycnoporus cinnabarinus TaxID=5643 RepID=A0A060STU2_PYCCI|nr:hypothetical protein BN946_scf184941.g7 [Trametes cinnabarina]
MQLTTTLPSSSHLPATLPPASEFLMSGDPSLSPVGPFYVILGGNAPAVYDETRPANVALGRFLPILPIVVCCSNLRDAENIYQLNAALFMKADPQDAYTLLQYIMWDEGPVASLHLETPPPYYAIRFGIETGIWIGFPWSSISYQVGDKNTSAWRKFDVFCDALAYMVHKPNSNIPPLPRDAKVPIPSKPLRRQRSASSRGADEPPQDERPQEQPQPVKLEQPSFPPQSPRSPSPVKFTRSTSPSKSSGKRVKLLVPQSLPVTSLPATPTKLSGKASTSASILQHAYNVSDGEDGEDGEDGKDLRSSRKDMGPSSSTGRGAMSIGKRAYEDTELLQLLRSLIRPPTTMDSERAPQFPVNLGPAAEAKLTAAGCSVEDAWTVLQVYIYAPTPEMFTHHLGLLLDWSARDALGLWEAIKIPRCI